MGLDQVKAIVQAIGISNMNIIGGIVFVLATVVFVMELVGYRPYLTRPFIRKNTTTWDAMALIKVAVVAALFGGGLAIARASDGRRAFGRAQCGGNEFPNCS